MSERGQSQVALSRGRRRIFMLIAASGVVVVACVMVAAVEFAARYYERHRSTPPDYVPSIYYPHRRLRYGLVPSLDYYGWFSINSSGFRGREFTPSKQPGVVRVVCLGGSTTFDIGSIGKDRPWPEVLENELRQQLGTSAIEVLNLGIPGATSLDSLIDLQIRALEFRPDIVVVYQGHNDFIFSIPPPASTRSDLYPLEDRPRGRIERWLTVHSLLYAKTENRITDLFSPLGRLWTRTATGPAPDRDRALEQGVATFRSNLRSVTAIARANGILLVLPEIVAPIAGDGGDWRTCRVCTGLSDAYGGLPLEQIVSVFGRYNQALEQLGREAGARYIPTTDFVPAADRFYHDSVHFGPEGSVRMGKGLADALAPIIRDTGARPPEVANH